MRYSGNSDAAKRAEAFTKRWEEYCAETVIPFSATDQKIAEVEKNLGPDTGILMATTARPVNKRLKECHFPVADGSYGICRRKGVKAHSISKSAFLDVLSQESHLMRMGERRHSMAASRGKHFIRSGWTEVSKNNASVFTGICERHDYLFSDVDDPAGNHSGQDHDFMLAFRPIIRYHWEYWDIIDCIEKTGVAYSHPDWVPGQKTVSEHENIADTMLRKWFTAYRLKEKGGLGNIVHIPHEWTQDQPSVAFSGVIGVSTGYKTEHIWTPAENSDVRFVLNVLPLQGKVRATLSMLAEDYSILRSDMPIWFTNTSVRKTKDVISSAMVANSEGLYLSKEYFNRISAEQKAWMLKVRNIYRQMNQCPVMGDAVFNLLE